MSEETTAERISAEFTVEDALALSLIHISSVL